MGAGIEAAHPESILVGGHALDLHLRDGETSPVNAVGTYAVLVEGVRGVEVKTT